MDDRMASVWLPQQGAFGSSNQPTVRRRASQVRLRGIPVERPARVVLCCLQVLSLRTMPPRTIT